MNSRKKSSVVKVVRILSLFLIVGAACVPPTVKEYHDINIDYKDPGLRKILDLQVKQDLDSLLLFTGHPNPTYRLFAANAFASFQSDEAYDSLVSLLGDPFIEVKSAAAFALGQSGESKAALPLLKAFTQQDSIDVNNSFNNAVLEAMGKVGPEQYLKSIATVNTYRASDTLLVLGQANAIYQYGLREIFDKEGDKTMFKFLSGNYPLGVKKMAAHYFYRFENVVLDDIKFQMLKIMKEHNDPDVRMALATALTRKGFPDLRSEIFSFYEQESDYRVKCNILLQLHNYPYISVVERLLAELSNENPKIGICAANYLLKNGNGYDAPVYRNYITNDLNPYVAIKVHQAILRNSGRNSGSRSVANAALKKIVSGTENGDYQKAEALLSLGEDTRNFEYIIGQYEKSQSAILRMKAMESLVKICNDERYATVAIKKQIAEFLKDAISNGTGGEISAALEALAEDEIGLVEFYEDTNFLNAALRQLVLPNELETYNQLANVIAKLAGKETPKGRVSDNIKPINWELFDQYSAKPLFRVLTAKGEIAIELYKNQAPQSVLNIIELAKSGYYNNKFFHRVLPNFVAQAGCPDGDGYGSLNFTIRSELNNVHYDDEGYLGYASAGKHTESSQWFISYSPTPHLNGKYTIFGKVKNGMDVVHNIDVGDKITRISISN